MCDKRAEHELEEVSERGLGLFLLLMCALQ